MKADHLLNPDAIVEIYREGDAQPTKKTCEKSTPSNPEADDGERCLTTKGKAQAARLGRTLSNDVDLIITSSVLRTSQTALIALLNAPINPAGRLFASLKSRDLHVPLSNKDATEFIRMQKALDTMDTRVWIQRDDDGVLYRLSGQIYTSILNIQGIENANRIAIFATGIVANVLAISLFRKHSDAIQRMKLGPCDGIRLSAKSCKYLPLET